MKTRSSEYKTYVWGSPDIDWEELNGAINFLERNLRRWGRFEVYAKEKWGEARVTVFYWRFPQHQPGWFAHLVHGYQRWVYRQVYTAALERFPGLAHQIIAGADNYEDLRSLLVDNQMIAPYRTQECINGEHERNPKDDHCEHCFENLGGLLDNIHEDDTND